LVEKIANEIIKEGDIEEKLAQLTTTFMEDDKDHVCLEARCIKAGIKQAAGVMGLYGMMPGLKELLKEGTEVYPELIPLGDTKAGDLQTDTRVIHTEVQGRPINAIKRVRYLENVEIAFDVHINLSKR